MDTHFLKEREKGKKVLPILRFKLERFELMVNRRKKESNGINDSFKLSPSFFTLCHWICWVSCFPFQHSVLFKWETFEDWLIDFFLKSCFLGDDFFYLTHILKPMIRIVDENKRKVRKHGYLSLGRLARSGRLLKATWWPLYWPTDGLNDRNSDKNWLIQSDLSGRSGGETHSDLLNLISIA